MIPIEELEMIIQWLQENIEAFKSNFPQYDSYWAGYEEGLITAQAYINYLINKNREK